MTNEEMQSTIHFILEQQAQFSVNMQSLGEKLDKLVEAHESLRRFAGALAVAQATTESNLARTDKNLNALILMVEKYFGDRQNGQP